jgi:hypothetical protein
MRWTADDEPTLQDYGEVCPECECWPCECANLYEPDDPDPKARFFASKKHAVETLNLSDGTTINLMGGRVAEFYDKHGAFQSLTTLSDEEIAGLRKRHNTFATEREGLAFNAEYGVWE